MIQVRNKTGIVFRIATITISILSIYYYYITYGLMIEQISTCAVVGDVYFEECNLTTMNVVMKDRATEWSNDASYRVVFQELEYKIDTSKILFHIELAPSGRIYRITTSLPDSAKEELISDLYNTYGSDFMDQADINTLFDHILEDAKELSNHSTYFLYRYLPQQLNETVIDTIEYNAVPVSITEELKSVNRITIDGKQSFSMLDYFSESTISNNALSLLATGMRELLIPSNVSLLNYENNTQTASWLDDDLPVRVLKLNKLDFTFYNGNKYQMYIDVEVQSDSSVLLTYHSYPLVNKSELIEYAVGNLKFDTVYVEDEAMDISSPFVTIVEYSDYYEYQLVERVGKVGSVIESYRRITTVNGELRVEKLTRTYIDPTTEIIRYRIIDKE